MSSAEASGIDVQVRKTDTRDLALLLGTQTVFFTPTAYTVDGQNAQGTALVGDGGASIALSGNVWRYVDVDVDVAPDAVMSFKFEADLTAEFYAVSFLLEDGGHAASRTVQLGGSQTYGRQEWRAAIETDLAQTGDALVTIDLAALVGERITGIAFIADDDTNADAKASWSDVAISGASNVAPGVPGLKAEYFTLNSGPKKLSDINFDAAPSAERVVEAISYFGTSPFYAGGPTDRFAARFTGYVNVKDAGTYTIYLSSDDGSALYLDGVRVLANDGRHSHRTKTVALTLDAGAHAIELRYFENTGKQTLALEWRGPDTGGVRTLMTGNSLSHGGPIDLREAPPNAAPVAADDAVTVVLGPNGTIRIDPAVLLLNEADPDGDALWFSGLQGARFENEAIVVTAPVVDGRTSFTYTVSDGRGLSDTATVRVQVVAPPTPAASGLKAEYFTLKAAPAKLADVDFGAASTANGRVSAIDFNTSDPLYVGGPTDLFAARFSGSLIVEKPGVYTLYLTSDDGSALYVDGVLRIDNDGLHAAVTKTVRLTLDAGPHEIDLRYFENGGRQTLSLAWQGPDTGGVRALISGESLSHEAAGDHDGNHGDDNDHQDHSPHAPGSPEQAEHAAVLDLVKRADATHVAVNNGSWFDPATWRGGKVPGDDARVLVKEGVTVEYDAVSAARLFTVRVDGHLRFATEADSRMLVDTLVVDASGRLTIGTSAQPVQDGVSAEIVIANNGAIDVTWDPQLLSRGVISHGAVEMHGQQKTTHLKVAVDPMVGHASITLAEAPIGWKVGDVVVIAGTHYDGYKWDSSLRAVRHYEPEDEVRTITRIDGAKIFFAEPLVHDHDAPRADLKTSVANYSRNVTIATEDAETAAVHERGHVMFMHSNDVDVRYAALHELGRTDKSVKAFDADAFAEIASDSNVKGRYAFHLHKTGVDDAKNEAIAVGNAVFGSPGWGFVQHSSNAVLHQNASYDTFGAGFVAETGNETGAWTQNIAIYAKGVDWGAPKSQVHRNFDAFDFAQGGDGFWFQGRMVDSIGNVAASVNHGFTYFHRSPANGALSFDAAVFELPEAVGLSKAVSAEKTPILHFRDNEAFAANEGLHIVKANPNQGHDVQSVLEGFTAWSVRSGAQFEYTSHYRLVDFDLVAKAATPFSTSLNGIGFGTNTSDMTVVGAKVDGFQKAGIDLLKNFNGGQAADRHAFAVIDAVITNSPKPYLNYDPALDLVTTSGRLPQSDLAILLDGPLTYKEGWPDVEARKVAISGVKLDGLGRTTLPAGTDRYDAGMAEVVSILEASGYYRSVDGKNYFVLEDYYTDRLTGEVTKLGALVEIDENVALGSPYHAYNNAKFMGAIDLESATPITRNETAYGAANTDLVFDLLANDIDPDGDAIWFDGILQPKDGRVFDNGDGTVTYRPDFGFTGEDSFKYWVTDGFGNFSAAWAFATID